MRLTFIVDEQERHLESSTLRRPTLGCSIKPPGHRPDQQLEEAAGRGDLAFPITTKLVPEPIGFRAATSLVPVHRDQREAADKPRQLLLA